KITREDVAFLSPYVTSHVKRFGDYLRRSPFGVPSSPGPCDSSSKQTQQALDIIYIMRNGLC
ncbi:hypothetical protein, partial [Xanthomonas euvesicatoria]|uniref:hypothetical protein n=1 Tax=Xanthomonas euvesicatoria TaxID=456327 RepID=UPI00387EA7FB